MNWYKHKKIADATVDLYKYLIKHPIYLREKDILNPNVDVPKGFHIDQVRPGFWAGFAPFEANNVMLVAPEPIKENAKTLLKRRIFYILKNLLND